MNKEGCIKQSSQHQPVLVLRLSVIRASTPRQVRKSLGKDGVPNGTFQVLNLSFLREMRTKTQHESVYPIW